VASWRLIEHGGVDGALNMAIDRAMQLCRDEGSSSPTLRVYGWARPTVTLGRFQKTESVDVDACRSTGIDVVRRATGGRGVLHDDEVTYSVVASVEDGMAREVKGSYAQIAQALARAYGSFGVDAQVTDGSKGSSSSGACYLATTQADLSVAGRKVSGSAQVWVGSTVLQHGSLLRSRDVETEALVFRLDTAESRALVEHSCDLATLMANPPGIDELRSALIEGFRSAVGVALVPGTLTARECSVVRELMERGDTGVA
jgi:lipoate-protein ligase A